MSVHPYPAGMMGRAAKVLMTSTAPVKLDTLVFFVKQVGCHVKSAGNVTIIYAFNIMPCTCRAGSEMHIGNSRNVWASASISCSCFHTLAVFLYPVDEAYLKV